jgi:predicted nicotinamide N-methyase
MSADTEALVLAHAPLGDVAFVPGVRLHQAAEPMGLWELTEGEYRSEQPPPFWAFAWAGGQGLARYVQEHPGVVAGRDVLDLASGSGLVGIVAALAGAASVRSVDTSPVAAAAARLNARANGVAVAAEVADILDGDAGGAQVVLVGDAFYSQAMAERVLRFLRRAARAGAEIVVGDPDRAFLPRRLFDRLAGYDVPTRTVLEGVAVRHTTIWRLRPPSPEGTAAG